MPAAGEGRIQQLLTRELFERLYVAEGRSAAAVAQEYGTSKGVVHKLVNEYGLAKRVTGPGVAARLDPDELYRLHNVERLTMEQIGVRLGVAPATAWGWMRRFGVPRRAVTRRLAAAAPRERPWVSQSALVTLWEEGFSGDRIAQAMGLEPQEVRRRLQAAGAHGAWGQAQHQRVGGPGDPLSKKLLERLYLREGLSPWQIAQATSTTPRKVEYRLRRFGIPRRSPAERGRLLTDVTPLLLRSLYVDEQRSTGDIAALLGCSQKHVTALLHKHGVAMRPGSVRTSGGRTPLTKNVLIELHVRQGLSAGQIAVKLGYLRPTGEPSVGRIRHALERCGLNIPHRLRRVSDAELERLYVAEGLDEAQIAERLGWRTPHGKPSAGQVCGCLASAGIARRRAHGAPNPDTAEVLRLHRDEGLSAAQIAARLGWFDAGGKPAAAAVRKRLRRAGVTAQPKNPYPPCDPAQVCRLYVDGQMTLRQVAEHLGWRTGGGAPQVSAVQASLRAAGVTPRSRGPRAARKR